MMPLPHRPFSYSEKESQSNDTMLHFVECRMCTIAIEALTPLHRTSRIKMYEITLDPGSFARVVVV